MLTEKSKNDGFERLEPETMVGDPLLKVFSRINVTPVLLGIAYTVVFHLARILAAARVGHLRTVGVTTGLFDDPAFYTNVVSGAVVWTYYTWMPRGIAGVFKGLAENRVIVTSGAEGSDHEDAFLGQMRTMFSRWWWPAIALAIAVGATVVLMLPRYLDMGMHVWWTADPISLALSLLWILVGIYCMVLIVFYSLVSIFWLRKLFTEFSVRVLPLHPDRAGGLSPLGRFTLSLSYVIAVVGAMLVITPVTRNYVEFGTLQFHWTTELLVGLGAYAVGAPVVFFAPLSVAHRAMRDAKAQLLLQIAHRFEKEYSAIQSALTAELDQLDVSLKALRDLQDLHETTARFPVWPFNIANLTRFGTTYAAPVVLAILTDLLSTFVG